MLKSRWMSWRWRVAQWLELRWWKRYLRKKSPEEYLERKRAYWRRLLSEVDFEVTPGLKVLDAGCGPAGIFTVLEDVQEVTALDPLIGQYERELAVFSRAAYPGVSFVEGGLEDAERLLAGQMTEGGFDVIYCCNAINHVRDWEGSLAVLTRLVKPGGLLLLTVDVHRYTWLVPVFRALPGDALHPWQHTLVDYQKWFAENSWDEVSSHLSTTKNIFDYYALVLKKAA